MYIHPKDTERRSEADIHNAEINPPEVMKLIDMIRTFEKNGIYHWDNIITAGDVYCSGAYPRFLPNEDMAL
eukprot:1154765-Pelagomonas_calceolata.AAC.2